MITAKLADENGTELAIIERDDWESTAEALAGFLAAETGTDVWQALTGELVSALSGLNIEATIEADDGRDEAASCADSAWGPDDDDDDLTMTGDAECRAMKGTTAVSRYTVGH